MMTRELIDREFHPDGIRYRAGESATLFLSSLQTPYLVALKERAQWLVEHFKDYTNTAFRDLMRDFYDNWVIEFQNVERHLGISE
jgi:hypothetical protein